MKLKFKAFSKKYFDQKYFWHAWIIFNKLSGTINHVN